MRSSNNTYPRKFLAAWINRSRKTGAPQLTCNNNVATTIELVFQKFNPLSSKQAPLKEWDEVDWKLHIDAYFESCQTIEKDDESDGENE
jgi:hypothetical protein